jgi:uncharacterized membrane protein YidH (DUF202 family)
MTYLNHFKILVSIILFSTSIFVLSAKSYQTSLENNEKGLFVKYNTIILMPKDSDGVSENKWSSDFIQSIPPNSEVFNSAGHTIIRTQSASSPEQYLSVWLALSALFLVFISLVMIYFSIQEGEYNVSKN